ncbi:FHA domain-containing protein [Actinomadura nitritigenes]|uniref:FHA domain-containing protein n=1 Tax=Actinomadura nitritigenes TaxID=134602 RepID=A0ABS3QRR1_9ACTN|nr:FHA domain-containing protein [Actinomadura nitritigenes]MBO2436665.1 FHA domain-containing protein [Actinomadura nitritigenes]
MATLNCPVCDEPYQQGDLLCLSCGANLARPGGGHRAGPGGYDQGPPQHGAPQHGAPQHGAPQHGGPPQHGAPQHGAPQHGGFPPQQGQPYQQPPQHDYQQPPQHGAPQHGAPQHGAPQQGGLPPQHGQPSQDQWGPPPQQPDQWGPPPQQQPDQWGPPPQQPQHGQPQHGAPQQGQQPADPWSMPPPQQQQPQQDQWGAPPQQHQPPPDQYRQPEPQYQPEQPYQQPPDQYMPQPGPADHQYGPPPQQQPPIPPHGREATLLPPDQQRGHPQQPDSTAFMCPYCEAVLTNPGAAQCNSCGRPLPQKGTPVLRVQFPTGELKVSVGQHLVLGRDAGQSPVAATFTQYDNVSRRHSTVWLDPSGTAWVRDEGSTNGTFVNGERLPRGVEAPLRDGDQLRLAADVTGTVQLA